ncbi:MAG: glycosyltransferase [candidate division KSB1 bacterium]|nr:glycosyltransferase [candidate division KSB1 bacterium]MDZ7274935.1 glycosyltransferase [candidate division KSB1 bacterium]MDZ7286613.1 glycosyltransferase [candidate division KSB1 bacterium]MDZ7299223.1 glycosyltransferase [candidate division KSB1 bacterium]MDZ7308356.1 glycosyltransferase [candidate division KSB1 bacterium]
MQLLSTAIFAALALSGAIYLLQAWCVWYQTRRKPKPAAAQPPVSILKPLCGRVEGLAENLESFARLRYPEYEIIFGLKSAGDEALAVARAFQTRHPELAVKIVIDERQFGFNPKVNNLVPMMVHARHDLLLISDDNVRVPPDYLRDTVAEMGADTGLVYNLICGVGGKRLGALLENLHLNSFIVGSVCFLHTLLRHPCVIGKSMLLRRSTLQEIGGLQYVRNALAEDYLLGRYYQRRGYRVALCRTPVYNVNLSWPVRSFWRRHVRWARMRFWIGTYRYAAEWLGNPVALALFAVLLQPGPHTLGVWFAVTFFKMLIDGLLARRLSSRVNLLPFLLTPLKDVLTALIWFAPLTGRTIRWREQKLVLSWGSRLRPHRKSTPAALLPHSSLPVLG